MLSKAKGAEFLFGAAVEPFVIFFFVQKLFICHDLSKIVDLFLVIMLDNTCVITILRCYYLLLCCQLRTLRSDLAFQCM